MLLVVDIGNSNTVIGIYDKDDLIVRFRMRTLVQTSDELVLSLREITKLNHLSKEDIEDAIISSVVPNVLYTRQSAIRKYYGREAYIVGSGTKTGINIKYDNPRAVGADRIVNSVAAFEKYGGPTVVIDMGTAITFDVINKEGDYLGGSIAPGVNISADALFKGTAQLPKIELHTPSRAIAKNTPESINAGIVFGYIGLIDIITERIIEELKVEDPSIEYVNVISTGGYSRLFAETSKYIDQVDKDLTLEGLKLIYERTKR